MGRSLHWATADTKTKPKQSSYAQGLWKCFHGLQRFFIFICSLCFSRSSILQLCRSLDRMILEFPSNCILRGQENLTCNPYAILALRIKLNKNNLSPRLNVSSQGENVSISILYMSITILYWDESQAPLITSDHCLEQFSYSLISVLLNVLMPTYHILCQMSNPYWQLIFSKNSISTL